MEIILHVLGLCPDSFSHFDIMDVWNLIINVYLNKK
jgi:hypothetical protein